MGNSFKRICSSLLAIVLAGNLCFFGNPTLGQDFNEPSDLYPEFVKIKRNVTDVEDAEKKDVVPNDKFIIRSKKGQRGLIDAGDLEVSNLTPTTINENDNLPVNLNIQIEEIKDPSQDNAKIKEVTNEKKNDDEPLKINNEIESQEIYIDSSDVLQEEASDTHKEIISDDEYYLPEESKKKEDVFVHELEPEKTDEEKKISTSDEDFEEVVIEKIDFDSEFYKIFEEAQKLDIGYEDRFSFKELENEFNELVSNSNLIRALSSSELETQELEKVEEPKLEEPLEGKIEEIGEVEKTPVKASEKTIAEKQPEEKEPEDKEFEEKVKEILERPPDIVINDQKIIFEKRPINDNGLWLFPFGEIAERLQNEITVDQVNKIITIRRPTEGVVVQLDLNNGLVTVNNRPFRTLLNYEKIILGQEEQFVPANALVLLLGLALRAGPEEYNFMSFIAPKTEVVGVVEPPERKKLSELLFDFASIAKSVDYSKNSKLYSNRLEVSAAGHNDVFAITSGLVLRGGTGTFLNFDRGNISLFKSDSLFEAHLGDRAQGLLRSPLLGGVTFRGLQLQTPGGVKDSKLIFGLGAIPSGAVLKGQSESFLSYKRLAHFAEWSRVHNKKWQYSFGEGLYHDLESNILSGSKQTGGLLAANVTKSGKYIEGEANLGLGFTKDSLNGGQAGPAIDVLLRVSPKNWLSFFTKGEVFSTEFLPLSGNRFFSDRKQLSGGFNLSFKKFNFGLQHSFGNQDLKAKKPQEFKITNLNSTFTPFKDGPSFFASVSKNNNQISSEKELQKLDPITNIDLASVEQILERRTTDSFRVGLTKRWKKSNVTATYSVLKLDSNTDITNPLFSNFEDKETNEIKTFDVTANRTIWMNSTLQTFSQFGKDFRQYRVGVQVGSLFMGRLGLFGQVGLVDRTEGEDTKLFNLNLNYKINERSNFNFNYEFSTLQTRLFGLFNYTFGAKNKSGASVNLYHGKIKGKVFLLEEPTPEQLQAQAMGEAIKLPPVPVERGLKDIKINWAHYETKTDEKGFFEFPSVAPGIHRLSIEYSDIPAYLTTLSPEEIDVKVEQGKLTNVHFELGHFGGLSGRVELIGEKPPELKDEPIPPIGDIRVYLQGTDFESITYDDGTFNIGDIKPGKYKLVVDSDFLHGDLTPADEGIEVEIKSKKQLQDLVLKVTYKQREQVIQEFDSESDSTKGNEKSPSNVETKNKILDVNKEGGDVPME